MSGASSAFPTGTTPIIEICGGMSRGPRPFSFTFSLAFRLQRLSRTKNTTENGLLPIYKHQINTFVQKKILMRTDIFKIFSSKASVFTSKKRFLDTFFPSKPKQSIPKASNSMIFVGRPSIIQSRSSVLFYKVLQLETDKSPASPIDKGQTPIYPSISQMTFRRFNLSVIWIPKSFAIP